MYSLAPQNASAAVAGSWYPSPASRGTWQIISTCISTLVICVWSAIHIYIPPNRRKPSVLEKARWLIVGLLAPDWLLFTAFSQLCQTWELSEHAGDYLLVGQLVAALTWQERLWRYVGAWVGRSEISIHSSTSTEDGRILCAEAEIDIDKTDADSVTIRSCVRKNTWTLTHGYYAVMGGFVLDSSPTPVFGTETRLVLAPWMIQFLMKHDTDLIPGILKGDIACQSKSGGLAKALLVVQLLYFAVSCTARLVQALPLSLLEVWTLAHALGAIFVYAIWWKKPLDIPKPTVIIGKRAHEFAAYFQVVGTPIVPRAMGLSNDSGTAEMDYLKIAFCAHAGDSEIAFDEQETFTMLPTQSVQVDAYTFTIRAGVASDPDNCDMFGKTHCPWHARERRPDGRITLGKTDILRWRLATRAAARIGGFRKPEGLIHYTKTGGLQTAEVLSSLREWIILLALITTYVLPHLLGWDAAFPTRIERALWRITSVAAVAFPVTFYGTISLTAFLLYETPSENMPHVLRILTGYTSTTLYFLSVILYILGNVYFLVESLRQLPYLPCSAFLLPNLSIYFPHFS
ncbi:uncharacterized protein PHACADRAFT_208547 [Phanerochaete carnosa HHB-10118-sp]|uniref:Uncharacterized protein n=1 Tax=Phanerochaete carnosa (strain HHB-10118-sp) TaxID=650164 RepID=K5VU30_PHACS|nr:uncharacterized protein PHACADRAFT_208547 [Phanerochaete carnosa HHB-10118-sp]EKM55018.1 hypothetical protein PHACADRAFT_208547 [Phanerochaete carnosa HHB-10118-sp]